MSRDGQPPTLLLDAGTGLAFVGRLTGGAPFRGAILLSHLHWDHTHGLPFFPAGDHPDAGVELYMPEQGDALDVLARAMSPPHFPIEPTQLRGAWRFHGLPEGEHDIGGFHVLARELPHKGGRTFGYRVSDERSSMAYLSDHAPTNLGPGPEGLGEYHEAALTLAVGVDLLIHDAQYTAEELPARALFGHAAIEYAIELGQRVGAQVVLLFHHAPNRTDDELDAISAAHAGSSIRVDVAAEGQRFDLPC